MQKLRRLTKRPRSQPQSTSSSSSLPTSPTPPSPGDQLAPLPPGYKLTPLEIRDLNELIRNRYTLDIDIWNKRNCKPRDRHIVEDIMRRSDATLLKIMMTVELWDRPDIWEVSSDWQRLQTIRRKLDEGNQKRWANNPPWENI